MSDSSEDRPTIVRRAQHPVFRELTGGGSLHDERTGSYFSLNATGALIWILLDEPIALEELATILGAAATAPVEQVASEVRTFVGQLASLGLVELTTGEPG